MIESNTLPHDALKYLNDLEANKNREAAQAGRLGARQELLNYCVQWYTTARTWRKQSYEDQWLRWQRNADGRYDPVIASQKKDWQSKAFVDITPAHRETIHAELYRLFAGSRPILDVTARDGGDKKQAENIRDLELREFEKSRLEVHYNSILEDRTTYGDGFCRLWYETKVEDRYVRQAVPETPSITNPASIVRLMRGTPQIVGYQSVNQPVTVYRGVRIQPISIWDFFPDPKALQIKGNTVLFRAWIHLQEILDKAKNGDFMPESAVIMSERASTEVTPPDKSVLQMERGISDVAPRREGNQKTWEVYELYGRLPQKWVYPLLKDPIPVDNAEKLCSARVIFAEQTIFAVELNQDYDGEPPFLQSRYFPVAGRFYSRGIPEMLANGQSVINEVVNQRLDEGALALQEGIAVNEKALVNPQDLLAGGPGMVVRLNSKQLGPDGDVRNAIFPLGRPDVKNNAGFAEVHEWERMMQQRTSVNRAEHAPNGIPQGGRTLGGMQMLKNLASEKFAFIAMLDEMSFLHDVFRFYWKLIYKNITQQDVIDALGPERAQTFQLMSPEEIESSYKYEPKGIFERESKAEKQARLAALRDQFKGMPGLNDMAFFDDECKSFNVNPELYKFNNAEQQFLMHTAQQMAMPMAKQMVAEVVIGQAVKDVERNLAEKMADTSDGAKPDKVANVPDLASKTEPKGKI